MIVEFWSDHCDGNGNSEYYADFISPVRSQKFIVYNGVDRGDNEHNRYSIKERNQSLMEKLCHGLISTMII